MAQRNIELSKTEENASSLSLVIFSNLSFITMVILSLTVNIKLFTINLRFTVVALNNSFKVYCCRFVNDLNPRHTIAKSIKKTRLYNESLRIKFISLLNPRARKFISIATQ